MPFLTSKQHCALYNGASIYYSRILNAAHVGDVAAVGVAVAPRDGPAAPCDDRPALTLHS